MALFISKNTTFYTEEDDIELEEHEKHKEREAVKQGNNVQTEVEPMITDRNISSVWLDIVSLA